MLSARNNLYFNRRATDRLSGHAESWMNDLPEVVRPYLLAGARPRIINELALRWYNPDYTKEYLDNLLFNPTGPMPHPVSVYWLRELATLYNYKFNEGRTVRAATALH